jgi:hypothetical protein
VLALAVSASAARAQCAFEHPKNAKKTQSNFVQAFVSCNNPGGNTANSTAGGGVPACKPPETFCGAAGNCPGSGWEWDEEKASGQVSFKVKKLCTGVSTDQGITGGNPGSAAPPPCNPAGPKNNHCQGGLNDGGQCDAASACPGGGVCAADSADLEVKFKLKGVLDGTGNEADGVGTLATVARGTLNDRANGDVTAVDFPAGFPFTLVEGKAKMTSSADAVLNGLGLAGLPFCSSLELIDVRILDENGDAFGNIGTFLTGP